MKKKPFRRFSRFPRQISQLAEEYNLGTPQRVHRQWLDRLTSAGLGLFCLYPGLAFVVSLIFSPKSFEVKENWVSWILTTAFSFFFATVFLYSALEAKDVVYEYSAGFLLMRGGSRKQVLALRWDGIKRAWWKDAGKAGRHYYIIYRNSNNDPKQLRILSKRLWKRCEQATRSVR